MVLSGVDIRDESVCSHVWQLDVRVGVVGHVMTIGNPSVEDLCVLGVFFKRPGIGKCVDAVYPMFLQRASDSVDNAFGCISDRRIGLRPQWQIIDREGNSHRWAPCMSGSPCSTLKRLAALVDDSFVLHTTSPPPARCCIRSEWLLRRAAPQQPTLRPRSASLIGCLGQARFPFSSGSLSLIRVTLLFAVWFDALVASLHACVVSDVESPALRRASRCAADLFGFIHAPRPVRDDPVRFRGTL